MSEDKREQVRRRLLKSIAVGSGVAVSEKTLFRNWTTPVVESVVLPAHAQTSPPAPAGLRALSGSASFVPFTSLSDEKQHEGYVMEDDDIGHSLMDALTPTAQAQITEFIPTSVFWSASIELVADSLWMVKVVRRRDVARGCVRELYWEFQLQVRPHDSCDVGNLSSCRQWGSERSEIKRHDRICGSLPAKDARRRCGVAIRCLSDPNNPIPGASDCTPPSSVLVAHIDGEGPFRIPLTNMGSVVGFSNCAGGTPCEPEEV